MGTEKTFRFRKLLKTDQTAKYILEIQPDENGEWRPLSSFTTKDRAQGYLDGFQKGIQYLNTLNKQIEVPVIHDEWK